MDMRCACKPFKKPKVLYGSGRNNIKSLGGDWIRKVKLTSPEYLFYLRFSLKHITWYQMAVAEESVGLAFV